MHLPAACRGSQVCACSSERRIVRPCAPGEVRIGDACIGDVCESLQHGSERKHIHVTCLVSPNCDGFGDLDFINERDLALASSMLELSRPHTFLHPAVSARCSISLHRCPISEVMLDKAPFTSLVCCNCFRVAEDWACFLRVSSNSCLMPAICIGPCAFFFTSSHCRRRA